ncbi:MAG: CCA tRNA nucleotidyltransferase [Actinobacteria bacterium]|nr:CCA tRNA nucleotidyltransferase [Actinomycetota bacterium]
MVEPTIVPRAEHSFSRRDVDPDALKVLYRLHEHNFVAYLVGGSVRDLLLKRRPKDFDIGTSAHPHQIKKLFRNCWIIGRRFRLAHVKFGTKTIEVATFRRQVEASESTPEVEAATVGPEDIIAPGGHALAEPHGGGRGRRRADEHLIQRDNSYGTPEEDAFRRDFTVNALFYDIGTFALIDYVGGLRDLDARLIRCIGDPDVRFLEDPVRMLRAVVLAARLQFTIDEPVLDAISTHAHEIARSAPARLIEEFYKILRSGHAEDAFRQLRATGLLREMAAEMTSGSVEPLWRSIAAIDRYRAKFEGAPESLTNTILAGTLLAPLGLIGGRRFSADALERRVELGMLPISRRDVERLQQILAIQPRLLDLQASQRSQRGLLHRAVLDEALTWIEIHGERPEVVAYWRELQAEAAANPQHQPVLETAADAGAPPPVRRRRRRRRPRRTPHV